LPILQRGVAHALGTVFPGMSGNIYLFAHSTDNFWNVGRYNAIFYLLKNLVPGDEIVIFYQDKRYDYRVVETRVVEASDVSYITKSQEGQQETLILQTCWPPGTTWKRFLVIATPK
jgi:sortase A